MNAPVEELKTRARMLLKLLQSGFVPAQKRARVLGRLHNWDMPDEWQLRHCLNLVAVEIGFQNWEHARSSLGGAANALHDSGDFWYGNELIAFTHPWFADYAEAKEHLSAQNQHESRSYLLPYRTQFFVAEAESIHAIGLSNDSAIWQPIAYDLVSGYGTESWLRLCQQRLQRSRLERVFADWDATRTTMELQSTEAETQRVMQSFVNAGRIIKIPEQKKKRLVILRWLVEQLEWERRYAETEINQFLLRFHDDYASLRREFIINGLMRRADGEYWRVSVESEQLD